MSNGSITLVVQVLGEEHGFLDTSVLVRLRNVQNMDEKWATTHDRGEASFSGLLPGSYSVEVSCLGFATSVTSVDVYGSLQTVQIVLRRSGETADAAPDMETIPRKARKEAARGIQALQAGHPKDAEKHLRKALKAEPQNPQVNYLLGVVLLQNKQVQEAETYLEQAVQLDPRHVQALTALGGMRFEEENYGEAASLLQRAIAANARQWRAHWLMANVWLAQHNYENARAEAELAVNGSNRSAPYAILVLGEALGGLGRFGEAAAALREFLKDAGSSPDASAVQTMLATMQEREKEEQEKDSAAQVRADALTAAPPPIPGPATLSVVTAAWAPPDIDSVLPAVASEASCPQAFVLQQAGQKVKSLVDDLDHFSATQTQVHERLNLLGNPLYRESRKSDYLVAVESEAGSVSLREYSRELSGSGPFHDRLRTRGMLALAFPFHPDEQADYEMTCEGLAEWKGRPAWLVHFRPRSDRPLRLQVFEVGGREEHVALKGRAWISADLFQIVHIEADLVAPMQGINLRREHQSANYAPQELKSKKTQLWLPLDTETYLDYRGGLYRLSDHFDHFVLFSVESRQKIKAPED
jgi:tetratricopeptide (TPR) repeat protein